MTSTTAPALTASPALPARPARAPRGFSADDRCGTCEGRGATASPILVDGEVIILDEETGEEAREATTCEDCEGAGWVRDDRTPEQVRADEAAYRARRNADHLAYVAEFGASPLCGTYRCCCPR